MAYRGQGCIAVTTPSYPDNVGSSSADGELSEHDPGRLLSERAI